MTIKLYNDETLKVLIPQGSSPQFIGQFTKSMYEEWKIDPSVLKLYCGCTSFSMVPEQEQIIFTVDAPTFNIKLDHPFTKNTSTKFKSKISDVVVTWEIKFFVNPEK